MGYLDFWTRLLDRFKKAGGDPDVTLYNLSLGALDTKKHQYAESYDAGATIQMIIIDKRLSDFIEGMGIHIQEHAVGLTDSSAAGQGDKIVDADGNVYKIASSTNVIFGSTTIYYICQLTKLPYA